MPNLPASIDLERALLGSVLLNDTMFDQLIETLTPEDFWHGGHQKIYARMIALREENKPVDMLTLCEALTQHDELERVGGMAYLSELMDGAVERNSLAPYIQTVRQKAVMRGIYKMAEAAMEEATESGAEPEALLEKIEGFVLGVSDDTADGKFATLKDAVGDGGLDNYFGRMLDPVAMTGIPTGYKLIDQTIGGLKPANLIVIAARPSMGKTAFVCNVAENVVMRDEGAVVAIFSLEMSKDALWSRFLASCGRVDVRKVRSGGQVSLVDRQDLIAALERLIDKSLYIDDSSYLTTTKMRSKCRQLKRQMNRLDLVVVDYLQLMSGGGKYESREKEVSAISRGLKALSKELAVPVVALSQMSRTVEGRSDKTPILSDLRESGSIEQDADIVGFIHRPEVYDDDPDLEGIAEFIVAKNRDGPTDKVKLCWLKQYTRFQNLAMEG